MVEGVLLLADLDEVLHHGLLNAAIVHTRLQLVLRFYYQFVGVRDPVEDKPDQEGENKHNSIVRSQESRPHVPICIYLRLINANVVNFIDECSVANAHQHYLDKSENQEVHGQELCLRLQTVEVFLFHILSREIKRLSLSHRFYSFQEHKRRESNEQTLDQVCCEKNCKVDCCKLRQKVRNNCSSQEIDVAGTIASRNTTSKAVATNEK